jgi:hypothetical protein
MKHKLSPVGLKKILGCFDRQKKIEKKAVPDYWKDLLLQSDRRHKPYID